MPDEPIVTTTHEAHRLDERERKRLVTAGIATVVAILVVLFIALNQRETRVSFVFFSATTSLIWVIVLSGVAGAILARFVPRAVRRRRARDR